MISAGAAGVAIGRHVHVAVFCSLIGAGRIELHDYANLSSRVSLYSSSDDFSGAHMSNPTLPVALTAVEHAPVTIGRHVIIGCGSVVLPGCTLHEGSGVGALSLVRESVPPLALVAGAPARRIGSRRPEMLALGERFEAAAA